MENRIEELVDYKTDHSKEQHVVVFSGGLDSAVIVNRLLAEGEKELTLIGMSQPWLHQRKAIKEREARVDLVKFFTDKYPCTKINLVHYEAEIESTTSYGDEHNSTEVDSFELNGIKPIYPQPALWLFNVISYVNTIRNSHNTINLYMGYLFDDCMHNHHGSFRDKFNKLILATKGFIDANIRVQLPLDKTMKIDVVKEAIEAGIYDLCWSCECPALQNSEIVPCGICRPCRDRKSALINAAGETGDILTFSKIEHEIYKILDSKRERLESEKHVPAIKGND